MSEWINVKDKLPEEYQTVLVYLKSRIYDVAVYCKEYGFRPWYMAYLESCPSDWDGEEPVQVWMPLLEPYKESEVE